jgi:hypothetical protein
MDLDRPHVEHQPNQRFAMRTAPFLLVALLALAACDRAQDRAKPKDTPAATGSGSSFLAQPKGFTHEDKVDIAGYFLPKDPIQVGNFKLTHMAGGAPSDFRSWEGGKREGLFGPLMIEFEDVASPLQTNELGGEHHTVTARVLPSAYHLTKAALAFHGKDPQLGAITFAGAFNQKALAEAKANSGSSGEKVVLKGDMQIGDQRFHDVAFTYWVGD